MEKIRKIIKEVLLENNSKFMNDILDKISTQGIESLTHVEKQWLDNYSKGIENKGTEELLSIDTGYEFKDIINIEDGNFDVKFIYDNTEDYEDGEMIHKGPTFINDDEYWAGIHVTEDGEYSSFNLHDGEDYVEFIEELEEKLDEFFKNVADKINLSI